MSFYDNDKGSWSNANRQPSWEQQQGPPSRSGNASTVSQHSESNAFASQFEEIDRATDNLLKSGKWFPGQTQGVAGGSVAATPRRESSVGRSYDFSADPRMGGGTARHPSVSEYDGTRPSSAGLQNFYAGQRFPGGSRQSEAEQMLQAKRRMAAQRERELRNYHQEQQYNRKAVSGQKSDRSMSPAAMNEEDRRELIARQHRALYGDNSSLYNADGSRASSQDARAASGGRGASPLAFDPFGSQPQAGADGAVQMPPRERAENTTSPVTNSPAQQAFGQFNESQQASRTSNSSPGASPPLVQGQKGNTSGVAPIGTRPAQAPGMNKRSTTPLTPSSLSYGFNASDSQQNPNASKDERSTSAASNPALTDKSVNLGNWGSNSGVWASGKTTLAVQPSVWG